MLSSNTISVDYTRLGQRSNTQNDPKTGKQFTKSWNQFVVGYQEYLSERILEVDQKAAMAKYLGGLVEYGKNYGSSLYNLKCLKYNSYKIALCINIINPSMYNIPEYDEQSQNSGKFKISPEQQQNGDGIEIVGVNCLGLKDLFYKNEPCKVGYVFDLR